MDNTYIPGDVLVFKAVKGKKIKERNFIGRAIARLTDSDVSHAALVYNNEKMVEMGSKGIQISPLPKDTKDSIYQLRHTATLDMKKVIDAADSYVNDSVHYDYPSLVILAGLIIYKKHGIKRKHQKIINKILGIACLSLDRLLDKIIHDKTSKSMMCSGLVYQCFYNAGGDYRLNIENPVIFHDLLKEQSQSRPARLIDLIENTGDIDENTENIEGFQHPLLDASEIDEEQLAKELLDALTDESEEIECAYLPGSGLEGSVSAAKKFLDLLKKILKALGTDIPLPALFVTPADLCYHTTNLKRKDENNT